MKIYICTSCRYTFRFPVLPPTCPDCGRQAVRMATRSEINDFHKEQKILAEEIQHGLYSIA